MFKFMSLLKFVCVFLIAAPVYSNAQLHDVTLGVPTAITLASDNITVFNGQYARELFGRFWIYGEVLYLNIDEKYERHEVIGGVSVLTGSKTERELSALYQLGTYYFPFTENSGDGMYLRGGLGYGVAHFESTGFNEDDSGVCLLLGAGYRAAFWQTLVLSGGMYYNTTSLQVNNPNTEDALGGLDGAELQSIQYELAIGIRI